MTGLTPTSSSFHYQWTYDVFINFRGEDTRNVFTGNLYNALKKAGVRTFIDDEEIRRGDEITPTLLKAIENSRTAITVFSENYASSTFCLNELVKIRQCILGKDRMVLPIFYDVEPSEVRHQKGNYEQALAMHKINPKFDEQMIQSWKLALHEVANISGFHYNPRQGYEYQLVERIVKEISNIMNRVPLYIAQYPVGIEPRMQKVKSLLQIGSNDRVIMVGICGIGGMGKTTIARAVYNSVADIFESLCFLHDIKEKSAKLGLEHLQETMVSKIAGVDIKIEDVDEGVGIIKMRARQKKVLLILDNVDKYEQLEKLAGDCSWFGYGSRIIITTRDMHLLERHMVERKYDIEAFNDEESLELLNWNAFRNSQVNPSYVNVLNRTIVYAQGLPLTLEVISANLYGVSISEWESALDAYCRIPEEDIIEKLKVSYDGLKQAEQKVFLDIACFYKGKELEYVKYIVEQVHGFNPEYVIRVLVNKCLMKIQKRIFPDEYVIEMHDMIQEMGREIVRRESPENPGHRSRLWFHEDIAYVLEEKMGADEVRMIIQENLSKCIEVNWDGEAFRSMTELKILIFENVKFSESPKHLPNRLKVLRWKGYPSSSLPPNFCPKKLVMLDIGYSYLSSWEAVIKASNYLGVLKLEGCEYVKEIPNLSNLQHLKKLILPCCKNLIEIHDSIGYLPKLETLDLSDCVRLMTFPHKIRLPALRELSLDSCSSLKYFPEILEAGIIDLDLFQTGIEKLPWSICNLSKLKYLRVNQEMVTQIPNSFFLLPELEIINFGSGNNSEISFYSKQAQEQATWSNQCSERVDNISLPRCNISDDLLRTYLSRFINVKLLDLSGNNFTVLPAWIKECHFLWYLKLRECKYLREVEGIPPKIKRLEATNCLSLSSEAKRLLLSEVAKRLLLSEELHGAPDRYDIQLETYDEFHLFCAPSRSIPKWFDHRSQGTSISFWVRNSFPHLYLCVLVKIRDGVEYPPGCTAVHVVISHSLYINGERYGHGLSVRSDNALNDDHLAVWNLTRHFPMERLCRKDEWNHVEVRTYTCSPDAKFIEESGIYVVKQLYEMEDITFQNPYQILDVATYVDQEQFDTWMKDEEGVLYKKRKLTGDDNFASSSTAL